MVKLNFTFEIKAPIEKVFAFVSDFRNNGKWQNRIIESSQTPDGPTRVGTKVTDKRTFLGQKIEGTYEVTEFVPNKKVAFKSTSGPMQFTFLLTFEPTGGGTKITNYLEMEAGGFFKLAEGALAGNLKKQLEESAEKLKPLLET